MKQTPATIFEVSRVLDGLRADALAEYLESLFEVQYGRPTSELERDLDEIGHIFRAGATPRTVRDAAIVLTAPACKRPPEATDSVALTIDDDRALITPEGRVLVDLLRAPRAEARFVAADADLMWALSVVSHRYGSWQRQWVRRHVEGGDLRPKTLAIVLFLLINRSIGRDHALRTPSNPEEQRRLAEAVTRIVNAFLEPLDGGEISRTEATRITSNWIYTEAPRQLPGLVSKERGYLWIEPERERDLLNKLAAILAARKKRFSVGEFEGALRNLATAYHAHKPALAALGLAHERPHLTDQRLTELLESYREALAAHPKK